MTVGFDNRMTTVPSHLKAPLTQLLLSIADDKLLLGTRNSDWTGLAPILEEDIAFSHLAQDEMAHAQAIYEFIAEMNGPGNPGGRADDIALGRSPQEYRCASIVEVPDEFDWATAICRQFFCDHFDAMRFTRLSQSNIKPLADLSRRIAAEEAVHVQHSDSWMQRLGRAGGEARSRLQKAIDALAPHASMLWEQIEGEEALAAADAYPRDATTDFNAWRDTLNRITTAANLNLNLQPPPPLSTRGGRRGSHTQHLKPLLDEMCEVYRTDPGATW
jgi:ring-1,2-phenylacetyl-CoA epoxidase subunit PaaC